MLWHWNGRSKGKNRQFQSSQYSDTCVNPREQVVPNGAVNVSSCDKNYIHDVLRITNVITNA